jgi:hypothetical protein
MIKIEKSYKRLIDGVAIVNLILAIIFFVVALIIESSKALGLIWWVTVALQFTLFSFGVIRSKDKGSETK